MGDENQIRSRKADHLDLCSSDAVAFRGKTTLLEQVQLLHDALPERHRDDVDLGTDLLGKRLRAPLVIAAMTGGVDRAERVNRDLATVAEEHGIAFGFGSMRPLLEHGIRDGYMVRKEAPTALILANIGLVQAVSASTDQLADLVGITGCDALAVHLNPAMELVQPEGDQDFRGGIELFERLVEELPVPVLAKETGCGLSQSVGKRLVKAGVQWADVSGAGGTSWVAVETLRARARTKRLGELFWDWGIPTGASLVQLHDEPLGLIATGGLRHGLDVLRSIALGARAGGMARHFLMAHNEDGLQGASSTAAELIEEIRVGLLLSGSANLEELRTKQVVLGPDLQRWMPTESALRRRLV